MYHQDWICYCRKTAVEAARLRTEGIVVLKLQLAIPFVISALLTVASPVGVISFTKRVLIVFSIEISEVLVHFLLQHLYREGVRLMK